MLVKLCNSSTTWPWNPLFCRTKLLWSLSVLCLGITRMLLFLNSSSQDGDLAARDKQYRTMMGWYLTPVLLLEKSFFCCCQKRLINGVTLSDCPGIVSMSLLSSWKPGHVETQTMQTADCRLQTVQTECYFFFFNLYLNFLVKFFTVTRWPVTGQGFQNTKWLAVLYILSKFRSPLNGKEHILKTRCYFYHRKVKITLYKKAFLFHHNVDKIMLKCISAPA